MAFQFEQADVDDHGFGALRYGQSTSGSSLDSLGLSSKAFIQYNLRGRTVFEFDSAFPSTDRAEKPMEISLKALQGF